MYNTGNGGGGPARAFRGATADDFVDRKDRAKAAGDGPKPPNDLVDETHVVLEKLAPQNDEGKLLQTWVIFLPTQDFTSPGNLAPGLVDGPTGNKVPGQWFARYPVHRFGETKRCALIPFDPWLLDDSPGSPDRRVIWELPTSLFRDRVYRAARIDKTRPDLEYLLNKITPPGQQGRGPKLDSYPISQYEWNYFVRALIVARGTRPFSPPMGLFDEKVPLLILSRPVGKHVFNALSRPIGQAAAVVNAWAPAAPAEEVTYGDMADPTRFESPEVMCIYRDSDDPAQHQSLHTHDGKNNLVKRFPAMPANFPDQVGANPAMLAQFADKLVPKLVPFPQVVKIADVELQVRRLAESFRPEHIRWAFADRPEWLKIADAVWGRTTHSLPPQQPAGYPTGYPAQAGNGGYPPAQPQQPAYGAAQGGYGGHAAAAPAGYGAYNQTPAAPPASAPGYGYQPSAGSPPAVPAGYPTQPASPAGTPPWQTAGTPQPSQGYQQPQQATYPQADPRQAEQRAMSGDETKRRIEAAREAVRAQAAG